MTDEFEEEQASQPLVSHLIELRNRLLWAISAVLVVFACMVYFANDIYAIVTAPLTSILQVYSQGTLIATDITAAFLAPLKLTFYISLFITMPFSIFQIWAFISPALYRHEKRLAVPLFLSSCVLFYIGAAIAYFYILPSYYAFCAKINPQNVIVNPDITKTLDLIIQMSLAFGAAFEIPVATVILAATGVASVETLIAKRPYVIIGCFVVAMFITPPDVWSMLFLAVPMCVLFEVGILFSKWAVKPTEPEKILAEN